MNPAKSIAVGTLRSARRQAPLMGFVMWVVFLISTMVGMSAGLEADTAADATINESEWQVNEPAVDGANETVTTNASGIPGGAQDLSRFNPLAGTAVDRQLSAWVESGVQAYVNGTLTLAAAWTGVVADFAYHNQGWISETWASRCFQALGYLSVAAMGGFCVLRAKRLKSEGFES